MIREPNRAFVDAGAAGIFAEPRMATRCILNKTRESKMEIPDKVVTALTEIAKERETDAGKEPEGSAESAGPLSARSLVKGIPARL